MAARDWKVAKLSRAARVNPHGKPRVAQLWRATLRHSAAAACTLAFSPNESVNGNCGLCGTRVSRHLPKSTFSPDGGAKCEPENTRKFFHPPQSGQSAVHPIAVFRRMKRITYSRNREGRSRRGRRGFYRGKLPSVSSPSWRLPRQPERVSASQRPLPDGRWCSR